MPPKQSFIFLSEPASMPTLEILVARLGKEVLGPLLPLRSAMLVDHESGTEHRWGIAEEKLDVPNLKLTEVLFLYGGEASDWNFSLAHAGPFREFQIATPLPPNPENELRDLWNRIGDLFLAAFTGDELEFEDLDLESLRGLSPTEPVKLHCDAAILPARWFESPPPEAIPMKHHAFLFRSE